MPIRAGIRFCINHPNWPLALNSGLSLLVEVEKNRAGIAVKPNAGLPLVVWRCPICGYVESYAAQNTEFWDEIDPTQSGVSRSAAQLFEHSVINALVHSSSPLLQPIEVQREYSVETSLGEKRVDAFVKAGDEYFAIEVKAAPPGNLLQNAAWEARLAAQALTTSIEVSTRHVHPLVIVPDLGIPLDDVDGVPVLRFDSLTGEFVNGKAVRLLIAKQTVANHLADIRSSL